MAPDNQKIIRRDSEISDAPPGDLKLIILHLPSDDDEMTADCIRVIADQIEEGYTSGSYGETVWDLAADF